MKRNLTAVVLATLTSGLIGVTAMAASPRGDSLQNDFRKVAQAPPDAVHVSLTPGTPRSSSLAGEFRKTPGATTDRLNRGLVVGSPRGLAQSSQ